MQRNVLVPTLLATALFSAVAPASAQLRRPAVLAEARDETTLPAVEIGEVRPVELAGSPLGEYPWFEYVKVFNEGTPVHLALDPALHGELPRTEVDVYVTEHRTAGQWRIDPTLVDVRGLPQAVRFDGNGIVANTIELDAGTLDVLGADLHVAKGYDVVIDIDRNGTLDPGDLFDGGNSKAGFYIVPSMFRRGPLPIDEATYSGGSWLDQIVYYPTNLDEVGEVPLIVISHGNGHNYLWYPHLGRHLSSWGYVVMSHSNNTGPGIQTASTTTLTNTDYFLSNLDTILGGEFDGHIDSSRITWMGHSRGGEGITVAYDRLLEGNFVPASYEASDIRLLSSIAPTVFENSNTSDPHDTVFHLWTGGADSDVNGCVSCSICQTFRLHERARQTRLSISLHGVGHGQFHAGGGGNFAQGPCIVSSSNVRVNMRTHVLPLVKHFIDGEPWADDWFWRQYERLRPLEAPGGVCSVVDLQYRPGSVAGTRVIDDFETQTTPGLSSSGGTVIFTVDKLAEGALDDGSSSFTASESDAFNGATSSVGAEDHRGVVFEFDGVDRVYAQTLDGDMRDFSDFTYLSFRAAQGTRHPLTTADVGDLTFSVRLVDGLGRSSVIGIGAYGGGIEEPYQRTGCGSGAGWANEFETIRIRLTDFQHDGSNVDLTNVGAIDFLFGPSWGSARGRVFLDDIHLDPR